MNYNNIEKIKDYLKQYKTLDPYLKNLLSGTYEYYEKKLLKQYLLYGKHPYPEEYRNYQSNINKGNVVWLVLDRLY